LNQKVYSRWISLAIASKYLNKKLARIDKNLSLDKTPKFVKGTYSKNPNRIMDVTKRGRNVSQFDTGNYERNQGFNR
jgi:hypothetical protein